jgi:hypothetical protein
MSTRHGEIAHRLQKKADATGVKKCEKTRDFLIILREIASVFAVFRSFFLVFRRFNREVVVCGGIGAKLSRCRADRRQETENRVISRQKAQRRQAAPTPCFTWNITRTLSARQMAVFPRHFHFSLFRPAGIRHEAVES